MLKSILAASAFVALAAPAFANTYTVETVNPVPAKRTVIADKTIWDCDGTTCVAELDRKKVSVRVCKQIVKDVGEVVSFKNGVSELTEEQIADCNKRARK